MLLSFTNIGRAAGALVILAAAAAGIAQGHLPVVAARASSEQAAFLGAQNTISDAGLIEDPAGSGNFRLDPTSLTYNSSYGDPNDESPLIHWDFGQVRTINRFRIWNVNDATFRFRGFRSVTVQFSNDALRWQTMPERLEFAQAPGTADYFGELKTLPRPITARYIRFCVNSTWRGFPQMDIASFGRIRFFAGGTPTPNPVSTGDWPLDAGVINVTDAPYGAKGDGVTDDTAAIQQAIRDWEGTGRIIYLPAGTYLVSAGLRFRQNSSTDRNSFFGRNHLVGSGSDSTTIRLKDGTFTDPANPQPVIHNGLISFWNGSFEESLADWFNNTLSGFTVDTGINNPGAKGIEFYSNNTGSLTDVAITSGDGQGEIGLDLGHADKNGPLLVKGLTVTGFKKGVRTGQTVNSQTLENVTLRNQTEVAFENTGQCVSVRRLTTVGSVQAFRNAFGFAVILDSDFEGTGAASTLPAIQNGEFLVARDLESTGFGSLIRNEHGGAPNAPGPNLARFISHEPTLKLFTNAPNDFLRLPISETPLEDEVPLNRWANIRSFRRTEEPDDTLAFQRAIDSGALAVYIPADATIIIRGDVIARGGLLRLLGLQARIFSRNGARIRLGAGTSPAVVASRFSGVSFDNASSRSLVLKDIEGLQITTTSSAPLFMENIVADFFSFGPGRVFARQLNVEPEGLKIRNRGSSLWVLGLKTERAGTLVETTNGGRTEILGGLCYTTTSSSDPMFATNVGSLGVSIAEVAYGPPPYNNLFRETRGAITRNLVRGQAPFRFSFMNGSAIPLFRGVR